uniref:Uncharacterized protein n=1 Tax=Moniliophthora roreri TaxID=221103 RepID=A0A0W0EUY7_MONRR
MSSKPALCSLTEWSIVHVRNIFEASSDEEALRAIMETFSPTVSATLNGSPLPREGIDKLVLAMRQGGRSDGVGNGLKVHWKHTVEVPINGSTNRDGSFGGVYIISGLKKTSPGSDRPTNFSRHKTVTVNLRTFTPTVEGL